ncbi:Uncharacterized protein BCRIVMBC845_01019 [Bacillus cereus]|nr:Uncharacterized protein BCRIVMBC845_01019 [Bacillus cereus]
MLRDTYGGIIFIQWMNCLKEKESTWNGNLVGQEIGNGARLWVH